MPQVRLTITPHLVTQVPADELVVLRHQGLVAEEIPEPAPSKPAAKTAATKEQ